MSIETAEKTSLREATFIIGMFVPLAMLLIAPLLYTTLTGDFPGSIRFYGLEEDSNLASFFLDLHALIFNR